MSLWMYKGKLLVNSNGSVVDDDHCCCGKNPEQPSCWFLWRATMYPKCISADSWECTWEGPQLLKTECSLSNPFNMPVNTWVTECSANPPAKATASIVTVYTPDNKTEDGKKEVIPCEQMDCTPKKTPALPVGSCPVSGSRYFSLVKSNTYRAAAEHYVEVEYEVKEEYAHNPDGSIIPGSGKFWVVEASRVEEPSTATYIPNYYIFAELEPTTVQTFSTPANMWNKVGFNWTSPEDDVPPDEAPGLPGGMKCHRTIVHRTDYTEVDEYGNYNASEVTTTTDASNNDAVKLSPTWGVRYEAYTDGAAAELQGMWTSYYEDFLRHAAHNGWQLTKYSGRVNVYQPETGEQIPGMVIDIPNTIRAWQQMDGWLAQLDAGYFASVQGYTKGFRLTGLDLEPPKYKGVNISWVGGDCPILGWFIRESHVTTLSSLRDGCRKDRLMKEVDEKCHAHYLVNEYYDTVLAFNAGPVNFGGVYSSGGSPGSTLNNPLPASIHEVTSDDGGRGRYTLNSAVFRNNINDCNPLSKANDMYCLYLNSLDAARNYPDWYAGDRKKYIYPADMERPLRSESLEVDDIRGGSSNKYCVCVDGSKDVSGSYGFTVENEGDVAELEEMKSKYPCEPGLTPNRYHYKLHKFVWGYSFEPDKEVVLYLPGGRVHVNCAQCECTKQSLSVKWGDLESDPVISYALDHATMTSLTGYEMAKTVKYDTEKVDCTPAGYPEDAPRHYVNVYTNPRPDYKESGMTSLEVAKKHGINLSGLKAAAKAALDTPAFTKGIWWEEFKTRDEVFSDCMKSLDGACKNWQGHFNSYEECAKSWEASCNTSADVYITNLRNNCQSPGNMIPDDQHPDTEADTWSGSAYFGGALRSYVVVEDIAEGCWYFGDVKIPSVEHKDQRACTGNVIVDCGAECEFRGISKEAAFDLAKGLYDTMYSMDQFGDTHAGYILITWRDNECEMAFNADNGNTYNCNVEYVDYVNVPSEIDEPDVYKKLNEYMKFGQPFYDGDKWRIRKPGRVDPPKFEDPGDAIDRLAEAMNKCDSGNIL